MDFLENALKNYDEYDGIKKEKVEDKTTGRDVMLLTQKDIAEYTFKFSGLSKEGKPKSYLTYNCYEFNEENLSEEKETIYYADAKRIELSIDRMNGFYTLDLIFDSCENTTLKMLWARLQKHKSNEVYQADKTWIFYMKLAQDDELLEDSAIYTANIFNPLAFYLIRSVSNEEVKDFEIEENVFSGGNTIRFLIHPDLLTFQFEELEENFEEENSDGIDE